MIGMLSSRFAAEATGGPAIHVAPGVVFHIGGLGITNSILYGWICIAFIIALFIWVARHVTVNPRGGLVQFIEVGVEFITNMVSNAFEDKQVARKYTPYFVTLFFFILFNTWLGLLPLVGEGFISGETPLFRPFTGDLNGTFAMAVVTMGVVYTASIRESGGVLKYLGHFFAGSRKNPLTYVLGPLEMFTDLTRVISLSLRLFLNVAIGEMVIAVFSYLGAFAAPLTALPFTIIEIGIGALQSYIFVILSVMYLAITVNHTGSHGKEVALTEDDGSETIKLDPGHVGQAQGA
jgi:F-type H+-transporting ATPase subunit a